MTSAIVTGGAGFIGSNAVNILLDLGWSVFVVDKLTYAGDRSRLPSNVPLLEQDITQINWKALLKEARPDYIINFAAETHVDRSIKNADSFLQSNCVGVYNIVQGLRNYTKEYNAKCVLIHISTDEVYGDTSVGDRYEFSESDMLLPNNPYSATKASADLLIRSCFCTYNDFNYLIFRGSNNFGPNQHMEKFIPTVIRSAIQDLPVPIYGIGENIREWLWVEDFVKGIVHFSNLRNVVINLGSCVRLTNLELVKKILSIMGKPESLIGFVPDRPGHDARYALNSSWACSLGYEPTMLGSFDDRIKIVVEDITKRMRQGER